MEPRAEGPRRDPVPLLILSYAALHVALGGWQIVAPGSFFRALGPFGASNPHYTRDVGTFTLALGVAFAIAYRWPAWRAGVVGYATFQYAFHAVNHLADIGNADPGWIGPLDFALIAGSAALLVWTLVRVVRERGASP